MERWLSEYLNALIETVGCGLALDSTCALDSTARFGWSIALGVAIVAGISLMLGQWVLLAINRVSRWRTVFTLVASGGAMVLSGTVEAALVAGLGSLLLPNSIHLAALLPIVLIAYAPYWLGFLVLLPYTGPGVARVLKVWHLLVLWHLLRPVMDESGTHALLVALTAWLASAVIDYLVERSPIRLRDRIFRLVSGSAGLTGGDLMAAAELGYDR